METKDFVRTFGNLEVSDRDVWNYYIRHNDANPFNRSGFFLCTSGQRKYKLPKHVSGPRIYSFYTLHFIVDGKGTFYSGKHEYKLGKGQGFLLMPHIEDVYVADEKDPWTYYWIGFGGDDSVAIMRQLGFDKEHNTFEFSLDESVIDRLQCFSLTSSLDTYREFYLMGVLFDLLAALALINKDILEGRSMTKFDRIRDYVNQNYSKQYLQVSDIANDLFLSRSTIYRTIKENTGLSTQEYLRNYRLDVAKMMLEHTSFSLRDIAEYCGFNSQAQFSQSFSARYANSPSKHRMLERRRMEDRFGDVDWDV